MIHNKANVLFNLLITKYPDLYDTIHHIVAVLEGKATNKNNVDTDIAINISHEELTYRIPNTKKDNDLTQIGYATGVKLVEEYLRTLGYYVRIHYKSSSCDFQISLIDF